MATTERQQGTLRRNLGMWAIVALGLGYMTPTVVFDTFGIVSEITAGTVPTAYLVALVVMLFTAISYGKMSSAIPSAGSAYTYVRESMHPNLGFVVGWTSLMDYLLLPMVNALIIRLYMEQMFPGVPGWVWVVFYVIGVTFVVAMSMKGTSSINTLLLAFAVIIMLIFMGLAMQQVLTGEGYGTVASIEPLVHEGTEMQTLLTAATVVCFSFIGFDAITMYSEEAKDTKTMPRAIILTVLIGGLLFFIASLVTQLRFPDNTPFGEFTDDPLPQIGLIVGGQIFQVIFVAAGFTATLASGLSSHASVSRMLLVMGRNGVFSKKLFGRINTKTHTPIFNVVLVGAVSLLGAEFSLEIISAFINFGALIAFSAVNASVIAYYAWRKKRRSTGSDIFKYIVMPGIGFLLTLLLWLNLQLEALIGGGIWLAAGLIYLAIITKGFRKKVASFDENQPVTGFNKVPEELTD